MLRFEQKSTQLAGYFDEWQIKLCKPREETPLSAALSVADVYVSAEFVSKAQRV